MSYLSILHFGNQFMQQVKPLTDSDIHTVIEKSDAVQSHAPELLNHIQNDEDAPDILKEIIASGGVLSKLTDSFKDPKMDLVSFDDACKEFREWTIRNFKALDTGDKTVELALGALDKFCLYIMERGIDLYRLRCDSKSCKELHIVMPVRIPIDWMEFDGMGEEMFATSNTDDLGYTMAVLDCEAILSGYTGLSILFINQMSELNKNFPVLGDPNSFRFGNLRIEEWTRAKFDLSVMVFQEWSNLMRSLHFKTSDGTWSKR